VPQKLFEQMCMTASLYSQQPTNSEDQMEIDDENLPLSVSGRAEDEGKGAVFIHQDASISGGRLDARQERTQPIKDQAFMPISDGEIEILSHPSKNGDGLEITDQDRVTIKALTHAEVILIDVPA